MNYSSILIVTYGRSGSTLLQGLLNDIDGVLVRGENFNFCHGLYKAYKSLNDAKVKGKNSDIPARAWFGAPEYDVDGFVDSLRMPVEKLLLANADGTTVKCVGYKEIRYMDFEKKELFDYLGFLQRIFLRPALIFNTRDHSEVINSGFWKFKKKRALLKKLKALEENFHEYAMERNNCYLIDYRDVVDKTDGLKELYSFLGASYDEERVNKVLSIPHSYNQSKDVLATLGRYC